MASRSFIPVRSLRAAVSRQVAAPRTVAYRAGSRFYSTEGEASKDAASAESPELVEAKKKAAELEAKVKELEKDVLYHKADIQTLNRRVSDERQKASEFAISSFARSLLSTPDILGTALKHVPKPIEAGSALEALHNGVELTQKAMFKTFQESGVVKMDVAQGTTFDPNLHEATFQIPKEIAPPKQGGGEWGPGEVVEVAKEGWMIGYTLEEAKVREKVLVFDNIGRMLSSYKYT